MVRTSPPAPPPPILISLLQGGPTYILEANDYTWIEMREVVRYNIETIGVDNVKLSMSGEEITEIRSAQDCYFTDEETAACVEVAHSLGKRLCAHARARDSVKMCIKHGVDVIYHGSYVDDEGKYFLQPKLQDMN
jgi:imidazolonepropionase-like amidohydrolase